MIHHGAFEHLTRLPVQQPLPAICSGVEGPVVLFFGLLRPYKGIEGLLSAWRGIDGAELWIVGRPLMPLEPLRAAAGPGVRFVARFISDAELPAFFRRADVVVLPYTRTERFDQSGVLATALALASPWSSATSAASGRWRRRCRASSCRPTTSAALHRALISLIGDRGARERLAARPLLLRAGPYSWDQAALKTLALYERLIG